MKKIPKIILFFSILLAITQCKKDVLVNSIDGLSFSNDTIVFDTVFTTIGSTTQLLKVYNQSNKTMEISSITMAGGAKSFFKMNVDGEKGPSVEKIKIRKKTVFSFLLKLPSIQTRELPQ